MQFSPFHLIFLLDKQIYFRQEYSTPSPFLLHNLYEYEFKLYVFRNRWKKE